jgi:thymidylate synthase
MWRLFEAETANDLWSKIAQVMLFDESIQVRESRAGHTREILHAALTLNNPRERWVTVRKPALNPAFALAEMVWILAGRSDTAFVGYFNRTLNRYSGDESEKHGAYGRRLRVHFGFDQLNRVYETLKYNPQSRQAVLQIWDAELDLPRSYGIPNNADIPCNTQSILKICDGKLEWLQIMRSNDILLGLPYNILQFTFLQEVMAGWLGIEVGAYHHVSDSLHMYEQDRVEIGRLSINSNIPIENLSLNKKTSDDVILVLADVIEKIINEANGSEVIARLPLQTQVPTPYKSILSVLAAEGLRRRGKSGVADKVMENCSSIVLKQVWSNWVERIKK